MRLSSFQKYISRPSNFKHFKLTHKCPLRNDSWLIDEVCMFSSCFRTSKKRFPPVPMFHSDLYKRNKSLFCPSPTAFTHENLRFGSRGKSPTKRLIMRPTGCLSLAKNRNGQKNRPLMKARMPVKYDSMCIFFQNAECPHRHTHTHAHCMHTQAHTQTCIYIYIY